MPGGRPRVVEASFLASFLGGLLSLLSPCSALLLPAFFAYAFQSRGELVGRTAVFYLGLCATLVPLGMGISAVSELVYGHRSTLITVSGLLIIAFGVLQLLGGGFTFGPVERLRGGVKGSSLVATFSLGAVYGFAGFCSGPSRWLRGREISLGALRLHTTNLLSGLMFVAIGALFIVSEGTSGLEGLYASGGAADLAFSVERGVETFSESILVYVTLAVLGLLFAGFLLYTLSRRRKKKLAERGN